MQRVSLTTSPAARGAPRMTADRGIEGDDTRLRRQNAMDWDWDDTVAPGAPPLTTSAAPGAPRPLMALLEMTNVMQLHDVRHRVQGLSDNMDAFLELLLRRNRRLMIELNRLHDHNSHTQSLLRHGLRMAVPGTPPRDRAAFTSAAPGAPPPPTTSAAPGAPPSAGTGETPDGPDLPDITTPPPVARGAPFTTPPPVAHGAPRDIERQYNMIIMSMDDVYSHMLQVMNRSSLGCTRCAAARDQMDRVRTDVFSMIEHLFQVLVGRTRELRLAINYNRELQRHVPGWRPPPLVPCTGATPFIPDAPGAPPSAALGAPPAVGTGWRRTSKRRRPSVGGTWWAVARRRVRAQHERMRRWLATPFGVDEIDMAEIENITDTEQ